MTTLMRSLVLATVVLGIGLPATAASVSAARQMVVVSHPLAAEAAREALRDGGGAVDAAIAAQMVLTLVEPQSSGIGGGAFLVHRSAADARIVTYDGRETAPASAHPAMFLHPDGRPMAFDEAAAGGIAVGVPGLVRMLALAHGRHGRLPWSRLMAPAIALAAGGFPVSERLSASIAAAPQIASGPTARGLYLDADGRPLPAGAILRNPHLAATLRRLADDGPDAFYRGQIASAIVSAVVDAPTHPGGMTEADLAAYEAKDRPAVCAPYRTYRLCGAPPPSSGPVTVLQTLGMLQRFEMSELAPWTVGGTEAAHLFAEAARLAFADRNLWLADPDRVDVPTAALLDRTYLAGRAASIRLDRSLGEAEAGDPSRRRAFFAPDAMERPPATAHMSIVDSRGDIVAMTTSVERSFGTGLMAAGFVLNNQLTDFAFRPVDGGRPIANAPASGKRPRSSMSPMIVLDEEGRPVLVTGSPGGANIINYVTKSLIAVLDWGMDPAEAVALPNLSNRNGVTMVEEEMEQAVVDGLTSRGQTVRRAALQSGLNVIRIFPDGSLRGAADPRREGVVLAD